MAEKKTYTSNNSVGALFVNDRRPTEDHPNFRGELTLTKALLKELIDKVKAGGEAKIALSVWDRKSKAGNRYLSIAAQMWVDYKKQEPEEDPF